MSLFELEPEPGPRVYSRHRRDAPPGAIYIGRGSPYGNPFRIGVDGTRAEVIQKYEEYLLGNPELLARVRLELPGKDLVCYCAPAPCHGDVLIRVANA